MKVSALIGLLLMVLGELILTFGFARTGPHPPALHPTIGWLFMGIGFCGLIHASRAKS